MMCGVLSPVHPQDCEYTRLINYCQPHLHGFSVGVQPSSINLGWKCLPSPKGQIGGSSSLCLWKHFALGDHKIGSQGPGFQGKHFQLGL